MRVHHHQDSLQGLPQAPRREDGATRVREVPASGRLRQHGVYEAGDEGGAEGVGGEL